MRIIGVISLIESLPFGTPGKVLQSFLVGFSASSFKIIIIVMIYGYSLLKLCGFLTLDDCSSFDLLLLLLLLLAFLCSMKNAVFYSLPLFRLFVPHSVWQCELLLVPDIPNGNRPIAREAILCLTSCHECAKACAIARVSTALSLFLCHRTLSLFLIRSFAPHSLDD